MVLAVPIDRASAEPWQLDLFIDGRDALLVHEVVTSLARRARDRATTALERLRAEQPLHPDVPALALLVAALDAPPRGPVTHEALTASIDALEHDVAPAARRLLGQDAASFLRPAWEALAEAAEHLGFDAAHPHAHRSWLCQQYGDWAAVRAAVEAEPHWATTRWLRHRLGLARHHLGASEEAIRLWLPLCWTDPDLFAQCAPTLPSALLRDSWNAFESTLAVDDAFGDAPDAASWFPAWLLLRHRGLARLFRPDDIPEASAAARVFRHLLVLLPLESGKLSDDVIRERRALRELSPAFFRRYMAAIQSRQPLA
ncbi:MAG TPA: hypothetical protein VNN07_13695 [Candidatus Tectomicrobia bacterium]|nr:hypothetical protein [Candidatus Tectomicrobia bacterium]